MTQILKIVFPKQDDPLCVFFPKQDDLLCVFMVGIENNVSQLDSFLFHCLVCGAVPDGNHVHVHVAVPCRYSVAYFDRIAVFEAPYCRTSANGRAHAWFKYLMNLRSAYEPCP